MFLAADADVADLRDAVKEKNSNKLASVDASDLIVYSNEKALEEKQKLDEEAQVGALGATKKESYLVVGPSQAVKQSISEFLALPLEEIEKRHLMKSSTTGGTDRAHPKKPKTVKRWESFVQDAANFQYPNIPKPDDVIRYPVTEQKIILEKDVDKIIGNHLDNLNRIFRELDIQCRFGTKAEVFPSATDASTELPPKFIGVPDYLLCDVSDSTILSFIEDKTPKDLPVKDTDGNCLDLLAMYLEDLKYQDSKYARGNIGRLDVTVVIEQVY